MACDLLDRSGVLRKCVGTHARSEMLFGRQQHATLHLKRPAPFTALGRLGVVVFPTRLAAVYGVIHRTLITRFNPLERKVQPVLGCGDRERLTCPDRAKNSAPGSVSEQHSQPIFNDFPSVRGLLRDEQHEATTEARPVGTLRRYRAKARLPWFPHEAPIRPGVELGEQGNAHVWGNRCKAGVQLLPDPRENPQHDAVPHATNPDAPHPVTRHTAEDALFQRACEGKANTREIGPRWARIVPSRVAQPGYHTGRTEGFHRAQLFLGEEDYAECVLKALDVLARLRLDIQDALPAEERWSCEFGDCSSIYQPPLFSQAVDIHEVTQRVARETIDGLTCGATEREDQVLLPVC